MKTIKFRIKNYKSIKDSRDCYLDNKITILAGKNEAGKTAIVEALEDFNVDREIRKEAIPIHDSSLKPEVELSIELDKEDLNKIVERFKLENVEEDKILLTVKKVFSRSYTISDESISVFVRGKKELAEIISKSLKTFKEKLTNFPIDESSIDDLWHHPDLKKYKPQFKEGVTKEEQDKINKEIEEIITHIEKLNSIKQFQTDFGDFVKSSFIPNFILFTTFEDVLPDQIAISQAINNPLIKDLSLISNLDFNKIQPSAPPDEREKHKEEVNIKFTNEYKQFWTQDHSDLYFWWDSNIYFRIKESGEYYKPAIRSKGRQWHLAYYVRVTARSVEGKNNIILIDEPGLFLHAKAQKDISRKLEECAHRTQIVYTTHSPYLIPSDKLSRVRLVIKSEEEGTKIEKITAKADKETLTPILTAIGEDLLGGIRVDKKNSIVVEGYSDYLWLTGFRKLLGIQEELNFVPAVGAGSSVHVGSILFGWGLDPIFILDNDENGGHAKKKLEEKLSISEERIIFVPENKAGSIEDLFSENDFKKYIEVNANYSKVLLAIQFCQKVEKGEIKLSDFSEETRSNFQKLFQKLEKLVK